MGWEVSGRTAAVLLSAAARICSKQRVTFECISHLVFFSGIVLESEWCSHTVVLTRLQYGRIPVFIISEIRFLYDCLTVNSSPCCTYTSH